MSDDAPYVVNRQGGGEESGIAVRLPATTNLIITSSIAYRPASTFRFQPQVIFVHLAQSRGRCSKWVRMVNSRCVLTLANIGHLGTNVKC